MRLVLDASAVLAWLHEEPGGEQVGDHLSHACISSVNWSEVVQKSLARKADIEGMREEFMAIGLSIEPFDASQAEFAGRLWNSTRKHGMSLGDRACLALAKEKSLPVLTADRVWKQLKLGLDIRLLR
ncbi:MAG: type II toxin-antitoxin system VapC family toxin [Gammaproteobacteria bacterium]|nr:type II toxin-antitoxin system VapC family toxin [Gammaproteobacteria bacterium]